ncbi:MAG: Tfp pilus assembly protein FimT/FimU [Phycisphaerales bacterium JB059]
MRSRGFTLLEVLVALGVLGVVLGLSMPAISSRLERGSFEGAAERLAGALRTALGEARASGQPVEVRARSDSSGRLVIEWSVAGGRPEPVEPDAEGERSGFDAGPSEEERIWKPLAELGPGFELRETDPASLEQATDAAPPEASAFPEPAPLESLDPARTLAVFLPGSEAIVPASIWLAPTTPDPEAVPPRWATLTISAWTARVSLEFRTPAIDPVAGAAPDDEAPPFDDLAPLGEVAP